MAFEQRDDSGVLFKNTYKNAGDNKPDYKGKGMVNGKLVEIAAWVKEGAKGKFLSLKFSEPREQQPDDRQQPATRATPTPTVQPRRPAPQVPAPYAGEEADPLPF